ncbi:MAG: flagellar basal-body rod protein FlgG [Phycisphaerales bacterium]|jgi:flagellar basal-body rod protein FlgG|nr:flagellar basal-body rod protein FlgG [Phycisphaerales bacterium]
MANIALQSAATGLGALNTRMDVIANNIANVNTAGFKASRANFQDLLYQERAQPGVENANGDQRPTGLYVGLGVKVSGTQVTFEQGPLIEGDDLDVAIEGRGFFQVQVEDSLGVGGIAYTRAGNFTLNKDGDLVLASDEGRVLDPGINVPADAISVEITSSGKVIAYQPGQSQGTDVGQIELAVFVNPAGLRQVGENLFAESDASGEPIVGQPTDDNFGRVRQGYLEGSNVDPTRELVELIRTQRAFEMNSQTIRAADQALQTVAQLRR